MRLWWELALKFLLVGIVAELVLPQVGRVNWAQAMWVALVVTVVAYALGDRLALPAWGNAGAVLVDFVLALALFSTTPLLAPGSRLDLGGALVAAGALAIMEILYHQYLMRRPQAS